MKYTPALLCAAILLSVPASAQNNNTPGIQVTAPATDAVMEQVSLLQNEWARIKYQIKDEEAQLAAIHALEERAASISTFYPNRAEPKIWEAIILSTDAGITKSMSGLPKINKAKDLLEAAERIDPNALEGSVHTSLGSLYYQVPGWPISFGDNEKAEIHLKHALQINPNGIDPNYFYGDFLLQDDRYEEAKIYLERAIQAPARPGREIADAGRRQEAKEALSKTAEKLKGKNHASYN